MTQFCVKGGVSLTPALILATDRPISRLKTEQMWHVVCLPMVMTQFDSGQVWLGTGAAYALVQAGLNRGRIALFCLGLAGCDDTASAIEERTQQELAETRAATEQAKSEVERKTRELSAEAEHSATDAKADLEVAKDAVKRDVNAGVAQAKEVARDIKSQTQEAAKQAQIRARESAHTLQQKVDEADKKVAEKIRGD